MECDGDGAARQHVGVGRPACIVGCTELQNEQSASGGRLVRGRLRLCLCLRHLLLYLLRLSLSLSLRLRLSLRIDHLREHWMRERLVRVREHEAAMATMCGSATPVAEAAAALLRGLDHNLAGSDDERAAPAGALCWWLWSKQNNVRIHRICNGASL